MSDTRKKPYQFLTDPSEISKLLDQLVRHHAMVKIAITDIPEIFGSMLLKADSKSGTVILDSLIPRLGNRLLQDNSKLKFISMIDSMDLQFAMSYIETSGEGGDINHVLRFPKSAVYFQQRCHTRIPIPSARPIPVILRQENGVDLDGTLVDISHGGFGVVLTVPPDNSPALGAKITYCEIVFSPRESFIFSAHVRFISTHVSTRSTRLGLEITDLTSLQQRVIGRFLTSLTKDGSD